MPEKREFFLHSPLPRSKNNPHGATPRLIRLLKSLSEEPRWPDKLRQRIKDFIQDYYDGIDRLMPPGMKRDDWENHWEYDPPLHPQDVIEGLPEEWGYSDNRTPGSGNPNAQTASNMLEMPATEADEAQSELAQSKNSDRENLLLDSSSNSTAINPAIVTKEQMEALAHIIHDSHRV
jgi:hypothetical protein